MTTKAVAPAPAPLDASLWLNPASALLQGSTVLANLFRGAFDHWFSVVYSPNINIAGNAQVEAA